MSGEPLSPDPEKGGNNKTATDSSYNKSEKNPKQEIKPRRRKPTRKWFGLTKLKWRELAGIFLTFYSLGVVRFVGLS